MSECYFLTLRKVTNKYQVNKIIMAISYSLSKKRMTFGKESGKLSAMAQHNGVVSGMEFARKVSRIARVAVDAEMRFSCAVHPFCVYSRI